jgi:GMP synthase-like glutamine amidotransferase
MILVVDLNWKKESLGYFEFVLPILEIAKNLDKCVVKHYSEITSEDVSYCDRIILSGTALKDNVTLSQPEKFSWIKTVDKPVLGICAGMQTIGVVFGLLLTRCLEVGMTSVSTLTDNPLFSSVFRAYSLHNYSVESSEEFEVLAESEKCVQAMKHKQKPIYGVLFHPEVRNTEIVKRFIELRQ